jgi:hypothetical protein
MSPPASSPGFGLVPIYIGYVRLRAQGWYQDPYLVHEDRYFSAGTATKLVRDGGRESHDPPPEVSMPEGGLLPAASGADGVPGGDAVPLADHEQAMRAVFDYFEQLLHPM